MSRTNLFLFTFCISAGLVLAGQTPAEDLRFVPDPDKSSIQVDVKATMDSFVGVLETYELTLSVDSSTGEIEGGAFTFDFHDLDTGKTKRNAHMLEWLSYTEYPKAKFELQQLEEHGDIEIATGTLTIHGVSKTIEFPIDLQQTDGRMRIEGRAHLDYHDFDLKTIRVMLMLTVKPEFDVLIHLKGRLTEKSGQ